MGSVHYTGLLIGICFVVLIQFASGTGNVTLNSQCTDTSNCATAHSECSTNQTCLCVAGYFSPSSNKTHCFSSIKVNAPCVKGDKGCIQHAFCNSSSVCECSKGYSYTGGACSGVSRIFIEISSIIFAILALRCNKWLTE